MAALLLETACRTQSVCFACVLPMERCGAHRMGSKRRRAAIMLRELATRSSTSATRNALREGATRVELLSLRQRLGSHLRPWLLLGSAVAVARYDKVTINPTF